MSTDREKQRQESPDRQPGWVDINRHKISSDAGFNLLAIAILIVVMWILILQFVVGIAHSPSSGPTLQACGRLWSSLH
jgi:hypothetical protein